MTDALPVEFVRTVARVFADAGEAWLVELPDLLHRCEARWGVTIGEPITGLSMNFIAHATTSHGEPVILKIGVPNPELETEIAALQIFNGRGIVRYLEADLSLGAMLLERLAPGDVLTSLNNNAREAAIAAEVITALPTPHAPGPPFPTFAGWVQRAFARLRRNAGPECGLMGRRIVEQAEAAMRDIDSLPEPDMLLHGDLHHWNILHDEQRGWTAIDPKGVTGKACLEVGRFLHNNLRMPIPLEEKSRRIEERVAIFAGITRYSTDLLYACTLLDLTLSLCWSLEEAYIEPFWYDDRAVLAGLGEMVG